MKVLRLMKKGLASVIAAALLIGVPGPSSYQAAAATMQSGPAALADSNAAAAARGVGAQSTRQSLDSFKLPAALATGMNVDGVSGGPTAQSAQLSAESAAGGETAVAPVALTKEAGSEAGVQVAGASVRRNGLLRGIGRALAFGYFDNARTRSAGPAVEVGGVSYRRSGTWLQRTARVARNVAITGGVMAATALPALAQSGSYGSSDSSSIVSTIMGMSWGMIIAGLALLIVAWKSFVNVGGESVAQLERRYFGTKIPQGRIIATGNQIGIHADLLGTGPHFVAPWNKVTKKEQTKIREGYVGVVEAIDGAPVPAGRIFGKAVQGHNLFQDGEGFLKNGGEKGPQLSVLPQGNYRINRYLFDVKEEPVTTIEDGQIGVVTAVDGKPLNDGQYLAEKVTGHNNFQDAEAFLNAGGQRGPQEDVLAPGNYRINPRLFKVDPVKVTEIPEGFIGLVTAKAGVALPDGQLLGKKVEGHNSFQDAGAFLKAGGQRGPQEDVLTPGNYRINSYAFEVKQIPITKVQRGEVAVIVSNVGKDPTKDAKVVQTGDAAQAELAKSATDERVKTGVERYIVGKGYKGIQSEVLGPNNYNLNTMAYTPYIIPTTNITIDWADEKSDEKSKVFNPLSIVSRDGFEMKVAVKVIVRVLPEQAPLMVARIGSIDNLINNVIHPLIDSSFRNQASSAQAMQFMEERKDQQAKAFEHVKEELAKYHVECLGVLICGVDLPEDLMKTKTNQVIAEQQKAMYDSQKQAQDRRVEMEQATARANQQGNLVAAEMGVKIAEQEKQSAIIKAEGESQKTKLEQEGIAAGIAARGAAEASQILAKGEAQAKAYLEQAGAVGREALAMIEVMKMVKEGQIQITPNILVQGGGNGGGSNSESVLSAFIASLMASGRTLAPAQPQQPQAPSGDKKPDNGGSKPAKS